MQHLMNAVDQYRDLILEAERYIWKHPETGYREEKTSQYMKDVFTKLGYELECPENLTGFITRIDTFW